MNHAKERQTPVSTLMRLGLTAIFSVALVAGTGCARIHGTNGKAPSFDQAKSAHSGWGPIVGSVQTDEQPSVVVLNNAIYQTSPSIFSQAHLSVVPVSENGTSIAKQSEPLAIKPKINPFDHPAAKNPLPEEMPKIKEAKGTPIQDKLALLEKQNSGSPVETAVEIPQPIAPVPQVSQAGKSLPQTVPSSVAVGSTESQPRARLAEPRVSAPAPVAGKPLETQSISSPAIQPARLNSQQADSQESGNLSKYHFSFAREIWLLIVILGGVFATLWFRLEYDFGSKARRSSTRRYRR